MSEMGGYVSPFDEIDIQILQILAEEPRIPYSEISEQLAEGGHELSSEGVRYRVSNILDKTAVFFLLDPQEVSHEIVRLMVTTADEPNAKDEVFDLLCELPFWHVSRGIGTYDAYAVGTVQSLSQLDELVAAIRQDEYVRDVEYLIVTRRNQDMESYLNIDYIHPEDRTES